MRTTQAIFALAFISFALHAEAAKGEMVMYLTESGSDVRVTMAGSFNTTGLFPEDTPRVVENLVRAQTSGLIWGSFGSRLEFPRADLLLVHVDHISGQMDFLYDGGVITSGPGIFAASDESNSLLVPPGYVSQTPVFLTKTLIGQSYSSLGISAGQEMTKGWGTGANADTFQVIAAAPPAFVPEPSAFAICTWLSGLAAFRRRRR